MLKNPYRRAFLALGLALLAAPFGSSLVAHEMTKGAITVAHPWARINIGDRPSAGYAVIRNAAETADRILAARSPAFGRVELHTHQMDGGVMRMRKVDFIEVPAGDAVELAPGGLHIMLFEPAGALSKGDLFDMTLTFEHAGEIEVTVIAEELAGPGGGQGAGHGGRMNHGDPTN
ncbi:MAG: copper chaperone PCu(A)C [Pseudomonadota bacterium]